MTALAEALQCPVDLPAMLGMAVLSLACAKKFQVLVRSDWDEPVNLYVVVALKPGEKVTEPELKRICLDHIANYKVPKQFAIVESLPKTAEGAVDKEKLRAALSLPPVFPPAR